MSDEIQPVGRTGWDVIYSGRRVLLLFVILAVSAAVVYAVGYFGGLDLLVSLVTEYWPAFLSPLIGAAIAKIVVQKLYRPTGCVLVSLDPEHHTLRALFVPDEAFKMMSQTGNNVVYHSPGGATVYLAKDIDLANGTVSYGWVHENDALVVMTREDAYVKWDSVLTEVLEENLELMKYPHIIGLGYARKSLRDHLDGIGEVLGFNDVDLEKHDIIDDSVDNEEGGSE